MEEWRLKYTAIGKDCVFQIVKKAFKNLIPDLKPKGTKAAISTAQTMSCSVRDFFRITAPVS